MQYIRFIIHAILGMGCLAYGVLGILQSLSGPDSIALYTVRELLSLALVWFSFRFIKDREYQAERRRKYLQMPGWLQWILPSPSRAVTWVVLIYGVLLLGVNIVMEFRAVAGSDVEWL